MDTVPCIKCGKELRPAYPTPDNINFENVNTYGFIDGVVGTISAGYGSLRDLHEFIVGVCDDCIKDCPSRYYGP